MMFLLQWSNVSNKGVLDLSVQMLSVSWWVKFVADMEEKISGEKLEDSPFVGGDEIEIVTGYGSREGFSIYRLGNEKKKAGGKKEKER